MCVHPVSLAVAYGEPDPRPGVLLNPHCAVNPDYKSLVSERFRFMTSGVPKRFRLMTQRPTET